jgi:hypothetical protein
MAMELPAKHIQEWFLFNQEYTVELDASEEDEDQEEKNLMKKYVDFFYDLYAMWNKMAANATFVGSSNGCKLTNIITWLLDDIPGVELSGSNEFKNCIFPKYPGFNDKSVSSVGDVRHILFGKINRGT